MAADIWLLDREAADAFDAETGHPYGATGTPNTGGRNVTRAAARSTGDVLRADEVEGGVKVQIVKLATGRANVDEGYVADERPLAVGEASRVRSPFGSLRAAVKLFSYYVDCEPKAWKGSR